MADRRPLVRSQCCWSSGEVVKYGRSGSISQRSDLPMKTCLKLACQPQLIVAVLCAAAIKLFYSTAGVDNLAWVLADDASRRVGNMG